MRFDAINQSSIIKIKILINKLFSLENVSIVWIFDKETFFIFCKFACKSWSIIKNILLVLFIIRVIKTDVSYEQKAFSFFIENS